MVTRDAGAAADVAGLEGDDVAAADGGPWERVAVDAVVDVVAVGEDEVAGVVVVAAAEIDRRQNTWRP